MIKLSIIFIIAYLLGSINTSIIVGKIKSGEDIRNFGSGNAGATNALRTFGKGAAAMVLLGDALKAVAAVLTARLILNDAAAVYTAGVGVVLGHNFPVFFGFKGGKGIVVSTVAVLFADWRIGLITIVISVIIMAVTEYVSLGSIIGAVLVVILGLLLRGFDRYYIIFSVIIGGLAIFMHRKNIVRLIKGTENKLGASKNKGGN